MTVVIRGGRRRNRGFRALGIGGIVLALAASSAAAQPAFDHGPWDALLQAHVDADGRVAYRRLQADGRRQLDAYLDRLAQARPDELDRNGQLAFWINAYNAMAVAGILDGYHAESTFGRFRFFRRYSREIAGEQRTLDAIEHGIVRPRFRDFRVHFAVNCASTSCPVLRREAYDGARLGAQLDDQGRRFLADPSRNRFEAARGAVELSRIFEWFAEDFVLDGTTLAGNLAPYLSERQNALLRELPLRYLDYDWTMNAQPGQRP